MNIIREQLVEEVIATRNSRDKISMFSKDASDHFGGIFVSVGDFRVGRALVAQPTAYVDGRPLRTLRKIARVVEFVLLSLSFQNILQHGGGSELQQEMPTEASNFETSALPAHIAEELDNYEQQIRNYRAGKVDETKMQKLRLHFGTYAQRQEGVQMQRIKIPGGFLSADQLVRIADAADRFGSGFMHFTTREDAQIYYVKLDETPELLRFLAEGGTTSREACGNTVRNITACYRSGTSATEAFDVGPYAQSLLGYLVRNKYNQNLGRKFKIAFEGCAEDHSGLRIHDIGLWARVKDKQHGFAVYLGGGPCAAAHAAK